MSPQPPPPFDLASIFAQQQANYTAQAATANALAVAAIKGRWQQQYAANQADADAGRAYTYPVYDPAPQKQTVVFRDGAFQTDLVPFPDLTPPALPTARPVAGGTVISATPSGPDKLDVIIYGIGQILARLPK